MASQKDDPVFPDEDLDDDEDSIDDDDEEDEDDDEELNGDVLGDDDVNSASPSTSFGAAVVVPDASVSLAVTGSVLGHSVPNGDPPVSTVSAVNVSSSNSQRQRFESTVAQPLIVQEEKKPIDEARRLFQRLWTDEDEIGLLQGFLDYTANRGSTHHHQYDTALFYDQIKSKLQLDFNKNQLVEKLRRLKKKYRNVMEKLNSGKDFNFKSPHDQATFEISHKIWSNIVRTGVDDNALDDDDPNPISINFDIKEEEFGGNSGEKRTSTPSRSRKRSRSKAGLQAIDTRPSHETLNRDKSSCHNSNASNMIGLIEGAVRSCLSPLFKELLNNAMGGPCGARGFGGLASNAMPLSFDGLVKNGGEITDERWRKQQILELEVFSKRLELVQDQIKTTLDELRSTEGDAKRR